MEHHDEHRRSRRALTGQDERGRLRGRGEIDSASKRGGMGEHKFDRLAVLSILNDLNHGRTVADMAAESKVSEEWMQQHVESLLAQHHDVPRDFRFERLSLDRGVDGKRDSA